jgi:formate hydrogenlyase transcriptional activator
VPQQPYVFPDRNEILRVGAGRRPLESGVGGHNDQVSHQGFHRGLLTKGIGFKIRVESKFQRIYCQVLKEGKEMLSDNVVAIRERDGKSRYHSCTTSGFKDSYVALNHYMEPQHNARESWNGFEGIVGSSDALREVLDQVRTVAPTDSTVLIGGETGTGKELIAQAIHANSRRSTRPLVKLNCAAIPLGLLESELFGHEKGAFTGAVAQKLGRFEAADGGTLFLDEIGDIPLELQAKLLRVLQEQEFERLGSTYTRHANVRVVAATNQDLGSLVAEKLFRMDLYYRLNVFPVALPPLRRRTEDIPVLVAHFVHRYASSMGKQIVKIAADDMEALVRHSWPGNIRELQNFVERAVILTKGDVLKTPPLPAPPTSTEPLTLAEAERDIILNALRESNWVVGGAAGAAARLGVKRTTLISKMRKRGVSRAMAYGAM